ncbi:aminotransferase class V-fold PLP-dependent enzyme [Streptomyces reniochalinae]|uniref:Aminotransferase class V-fold PLP-dependent enzyme n=1 Tax=Streptomyces reniochalinae TaxID=2250578 RepID=A0A367EFS4_9ACTN|nr:aminotransferase class V-fold PLP-dependent enzyme [Streptomyces reniochalinae]RCG16505.1 aminotransferase class V-fold PLP-dependent enzyme [Streptomyces reniochalinae]
MTPSTEPGQGAGHPFEDWALDPAVRHLNHGSYGAVPRAALAAQQALRTEMDAGPDPWFRGLPERVAHARTHIARYLRTPPEDLALVANASAGVSAVLGSITLPPETEVLLTDHAYGAVVWAVERAARRAGARVRTVHLPLGATAEEITARVGAALAAGPVSLLVVDQITSATARLFPVADLVGVAHSAGARVLVDGAHGPGMLADPLAHAGEADYWVGNLHKWPCTPRGTGALVARGPLAQELYPVVDSWGAPEPFPQRFDHQGTADLTAWLAAPAALEFIERRYGWDAARARMTQLADAAQHTLAAALGRTEAPAELAACAAPAMRLVPLPAGLAADQEAAHALQRRISARTGCDVACTTWNGRGFLRLSAHLYNDAADYAHLAEQLPACLAECRADTETTAHPDAPGAHPEAPGVRAADAAHGDAHADASGAGVDAQA